MNHSAMLMRTINTKMRRSWKTRTIQQITLHINQDVPSDSPSGSYVLTISATDQDNAQIFCVVVSFDLLDSPGLPTPPHLRIDRSHQHHRMIHNPQGNNMLPQREEKLSPSQEEMIRSIQEKWTRHGQK